jgi:hypothetical protein
VLNVQIEACGMIPPFNELGNLPPGVHPATLDEIADRFGTASELRRVQMESIHWMVDLAKQAEVSKIVLNGNFVTDIIEPNDVDCVLLVDRRSMQSRVALTALRKGLPFLKIAVVRALVFDKYVEDIFAADRAGISKGMVEVIRWT